MQLSITDWIRRQEVLLLIIYNNHNKICDIFSFSKIIKTQHIPTVFLLELKIKKPFKCMQTMSNYFGITHTALLYFPISAEIRTIESQSDLRIFYSYCYDKNQVAASWVYSAPAPHIQLPKLAYGQAILIWQQGRGGETATCSMHESYSSWFTYWLFTKDKLM